MFNKSFIALTIIGILVSLSILGCDTKQDKCTKLCSGDNPSPYEKSACRNACAQIKYYGGEEALDKAIYEYSPEGVKAAQKQKALTEQAALEKKNKEMYGKANTELEFNQTITECYQMMVNLMSAKFYSGYLAVNSSGDIYSSAFCTVPFDNESERMEMVNRGPTPWPCDKRGGMQGFSVEQIDTLSIINCKGLALTLDKDSLHSKYVEIRNETLYWKKIKNNTLVG